MVCLASGPAQEHGRYGCILRNDDHEYRVHCSTVSKRVLPGEFSADVGGFSKGEGLCGEREGWLPGKLDTFHQRHLGKFLSYSFF